MDPRRPTPGESSHGSDPERAARVRAARESIARRMLPALAEALSPTSAPALLPERAPFAWQHGSRVLILEARPLGWVVAELRFDPSACHYVEVNRAHFRWPREATGAFLSRVLGAGQTAAERTSLELHNWLVQ